MKLTVQQAIANNPEFAGVIPAKLVEELAASEGMIDAFLEIAQSYAIIPTSGFKVGAVATGHSGAMYLGANFEVAGESLALSLHAEQSAVNNAYLNGETGIRRLSISASPCGHCRQFLQELNNAEELEIDVVGQPPTSLKALLPNPFGPRNLGVSAALFSNKPNKLTLDENSGSFISEKSNALALETMNKSYAPYTQSPSAVVVEASKTLVAGIYIESAAYNPSLPPIMSALDRLRFQKTDFDDIENVVLVENVAAKLSQRHGTQRVLAAIAPKASLRVFNAMAEK